MRTCQSCGLENPDDRDFCDCGEYLRWDPTGFVQAVTPEMAAAAAAEAPQPAEPAAPPPPPAQPATPPAPPAATPPPVAPATESPFETYAAPPPPVPPQDEPTPAPEAPEAENGHALIPTPPPVKAAPQPSQGGTLVQGAVPAPPPPPAQATPEPPAMASITLNLPDEDSVKDDVLALGVDPGGRERVQALVRNQSGIVDNYELKVAGLPDEWWTIYPNTLYLVPFGTGGTYEQQVEIHLHPPRTPEAEARLWDLALVAQSKAYNTQAASAPFVLGIQPFEQFDTKVKPERASGRRKAKFQVAVENKANAPVRIGFEGVEPDNECKFAFAPGQVELAPGQTTQTTMIVRPPKQIWIGRPHERRLEVKTHTGENADLLEAQQASADGEDAYLDQLGGEGEEGAEGGGHADAAKGLLKKAGVRGPQMAKPKLGGGGLSVGPKGVKLREPAMRAPRMRGPRMQQKNIRLDQLKVPSRGGGAPPPVTGPLLPTQAVFRQKSWLPWWVAVVVPLLALLGLLLFLLLPKNTIVPNVIGQKSAFDAEKKITEAGLTLSPQQKTAVVKDAKQVGFVLDQTPKAGEKAEKGKTQVSVVIGIGTGQIEVPKIVGLDLAGAEKKLRESKLTLGKSSINPPDPKAKISSQIPAEREVVKEGTPVDFFYVDPAAAKAKEDAKKKGGGGAGGAGGGAAADIIVPAIAGQKLDAFAQTISKDKLVPQVVKKFDNSPKGTLFATDPPGGTKVEAGSTVKLLVSAGFPQLAFDDDKDVLLISGANGEKLDPIAKGNQAEKDPTWSFAGDRVAFQSEGQVFLKDPAKPDETAIPLTQPGDFFKDLAWAPTGNANVLAMLRVPDKGLRELCLGQITKDGITPACLAGPTDVMMDSSVNWSPDGRSILVFGFKVDATGQSTGAFGMVRFSTKKPFSFDVKDWKRPTRFLSDVSETGKGMLDAAISPDGKQMAVVANFNAPQQFRVLIAKRNDFLLQNAKDLKVKACKVIWLPDQTELLVVQADDCNTFKTGDLVRVNLKDPDKQQQLRLAGDNPSYQPLTIK